MLHNLRRLRNLGMKDFIFPALLLQIATYLILYMNIQVIRMTFCFAYLLFFPGIVILKFLSLDTFDIWDKILFSVGLSIAFLMFVGFLVNELGKIVTISPLSLNSLILSINTILLLLVFANNTHKSRHLPYKEKAETKFSVFIPFILIAALLLILGAYGIFLVNTSGNNFFLFILVLTISFTTLIAIKFISAQHYPFLLLIIFICSLLFLSSAGYALITPYVIGLGDQWFEHCVFKLTGNCWNPAFYIPNLEITSTYSMMSVTILPVIFQIITGMDSSLLIKLLFPIIASFIAIGAYKLFQTQIDDKSAFLATFYLIVVSAFKGMGSGRQQVAQLFYVLLFLILFRKDIPRFQRSLLLIIFGAALVVSHYSLSYIFLFTLIFLVLVLALIEHREGGCLYRIKPFLFFALIFSIITFSWYTLLNGSAVFNKFQYAVQTIVNNLDQFFNIHSRGTALQGLGYVETPTIFHKISSALFIFTELLLLIGFIKLIKSKRSSFFDIQYKILVFLNMSIIGVNILLPRVADTFLMERFYQTTLFILAPLVVIGGKALLKFALKHRFNRFYIIILMLSVFIPLFLFQTGFVYELAGVQNWSISFCKHRTSQEELYRRFGCINDYNFYSTYWLNNVISSSMHYVIYADDQARRTELIAYAKNTVGHVKTISNGTKIKSNDFVYLNPSNVICGTIVGEKNTWNINELHFLNYMNKLYTNGGSEVYKNN